MRNLLALTALLLAAGCAGVPNNHTFTPVTPRVLPEPEAMPPSPLTGSIYGDARGLRLFEDRTARQVGDILTIRLVENTNASKRASSSVDKTGEVGINNPVLFGAPFSWDGNTLDSSVSGTRAFEGGGDADQSNSLNGQISAVVVAVYPNGNLAVRGEKMLTLNQGQEFVQISGVVRPEDVSPENTVLSTRVADAQITYAGKGAIADANAPGWLGRFFLSPLWPF